jgi:hypothetical protein
MDLGTKLCILKHQSLMPQTAQFLFVLTRLDFACRFLSFRHPLQRFCFSEKRGGVHSSEKVFFEKTRRLCEQGPSQ